MFQWCSENNTKIFRLCPTDALKIIPRFIACSSGALKIIQRFLDYVPVML